MAAKKERLVVSENDFSLNINQILTPSTLCSKIISGNNAELTKTSFSNLLKTPFQNSNRSDNEPATVPRRRRSSNLSSICRRSLTPLQNSTVSGISTTDSMPKKVCWGRKKLRLSGFSQEFQSEDESSNTVPGSTLENKLRLSELSSDKKLNVGNAENKTQEIENDRFESGAVTSVIESSKHKAPQSDVSLSIKEGLTPRTLIGNIISTNKVPTLALQANLFKTPLQNSNCSERKPAAVTPRRRSSRLSSICKKSLTPLQNSIVSDIDTPDDSVPKKIYIGRKNPSQFTFAQGFTIPSKDVFPNTISGSLPKTKPTEEKNLRSSKDKQTLLDSVSSENDMVTSEESSIKQTNDEHACEKIFKTPDVKPVKRARQKPSDQQVNGYIKNKIEEMENDHSENGGAGTVGKSPTQGVPESDGQFQATENVNLIEPNSSTSGNQSDGIFAPQNDAMESSVEEKSPERTVDGNLGGSHVQDNGILESQVLAENKNLIVRKRKKASGKKHQRLSEVAIDENDVSSTFNRNLIEKGRNPETSPQLNQSSSFRSISSPEVNKAKITLKQTKLPDSFGVVNNGIQGVETSQMLNALGGEPKAKYRRSSRLSSICRASLSPLQNTSVSDIDTPHSVPARKYVGRKTLRLSQSGTLAWSMEEKSCEETDADGNSEKDSILKDSSEPQKLTKDEDLPTRKRKMPLEKKEQEHQRLSYAVIDENDVSSTFNAGKMLDSEILANYDQNGSSGGNISPPEVDSNEVTSTVNDIHLMNNNGLNKPKRQQQSKLLDSSHAVRNEETSKVSSTSIEEPNTSFQVLMDSPSDVLTNEMMTKKRTATSNLAQSGTPAGLQKNESISNSGSLILPSLAIDRSRMSKSSSKCESAVTRPIATKKKVNRRAVSKPAVQSPFSRALTQHFLHHFSQFKISSDATRVFEDCAENYHKWISDQLFSICTKRDSKTIRGEDVLLLMKKQGFSKNMKSVNLFVEKHFPMQLRREVITRAMPENVLHPK